ncbi:MAG: hypothetical protein AAGE52_37535 [Myxococcota bacterium]
MKFKSDIQPQISDSNRVYNTALVTLVEKGFQVWFDQQSGLFRAEKDGWDFAALEPTKLLGVVAIYEHVAPREYGEYWWRLDEPRLVDSVPVVNADTESEDD